MKIHLLLLNFSIVFSLIFFVTDARAEVIPGKEEIINLLVSDYAITDERVLEAVGKVDRAKFVPDEFRDRAYDDERLPIGSGKGQRITLVPVVAQTLELLKLRGSEKILEIGTGSGYQTAVIAGMVKEVYTIEIDEALAKKAQGIFNELGYKNIKLICGDGFMGWEEFAPYDIILVGAFLRDDIPPALLRQLSEGGRIVIPMIVAEPEKIGLMIKKKINGKIVEEWVGYNGRGYK
ncbi:MAG: protein-L-isoaspartate O-methyltransferase [Candidatus Omnitrophica bacterium CG11_big_fil_rev_8_21_14_0_20_42_13]|uniref:Protein-L-isoaspartate O-methyltransferase n=1 Tax=Candidatus Ghiorseimicrobium undicola TaxID=1974746 RepID=A0A2H0LYA9_9BACT|nr:MAG: protein-L-isoaspartate O-methyltransferase [Candidatus Omnitrophica bacterium CG11_big_fil_rev_8_21_14_0_20_42_13]